MAFAPNQVVRKSAKRWKYITVTLSLGPVGQPVNQNAPKPPCMRRNTYATLLFAPQTSMATMDSVYSWWVAALALLIGSASFGAVTSIPILLKPLTEDWGASTRALALVHCSTLVGAGIGSLVLGRLLDRFGFFAIALIGASATSAGLLLASNATHLLTLYLAYGVLVGGIGQGVFFSPLAAAVSQWFDRHRALAIAIATCGQSVGGFIVPPLLRSGAEQWGWRSALAYYGFASGALLLVCALVFRRKPPSSLGGVLQASPNAERPLQHRGFLRLGVCQGLFSFAAFMVLGHLTAAGEERHFSPTAAAALLSATLGVALFSRLSIGVMCTAFGRYRTLLAASAFHAAGVVCLVLFTSDTGLAIAVTLMGLGFGACVPCYAVLVREMFPVRESGRRIAEIYCFGFLTAGAGSWLGGWMRDAYGNYSIAFACAALGALAGVTLLLCGFRDFDRI